MTVSNNLQQFRCGKAQWVSRQTRNRPVASSRCFLEKETLPSLLSTFCFQERIRA